MAPKKAKNKYAPSQEFLDSCYEKGTRLGTATGKAEKAATAAVKNFSKSALNLTSDAATQVQEKLTWGIHKVMGSDEYKKKALDVNARLTNALASVEDSINMNLKSDIQELANSMDADPKIIQELGSLSTQKFLLTTLADTFILEGVLLLIHRHFENRVDLQRHRIANDRIRSFIRILVEKFPEEFKTIPDKLVNPVQRVTYLISDPPVTGPVTANTMQLAHKTLKHLRAALALVVANCETLAEAAKVGLYGFECLKFLSEYFESLKID